MTKLKSMAAVLLALLPCACTVWPDSQSGVPNKSFLFGVGGYAPAKPPYAISFQQQDSAGNWVTTSSGMTADGSQVFPPFTTWYPWVATFTPSADSKYWTDSATFGGVVSTKMRSPQTPYVTKDLYIAEDCLFTVPPDASGTVQPATIAATCGDPSGVVTLHTCRNGPASSPSSYDCGPAGYPANTEHADLAVLTGVSSIGTFGNKITGRRTDAQRSQVRTFLQQRLSQYGITATLDSYATGANVVGSLPQTTGPTAKPILIGAHFDTSTEFNAGAIDNGVGVVVMLDLANFVSNLPMRSRPVFFVAFDGEESSLSGSTHFLKTTTGQQAWHSVHIFDQIGSPQSGANIEAYSSLTDCLWNSYNAANSDGAYAIPLTRVAVLTDTDSAPFVMAGFRAINVSTKANSGSSIDCIDNRPCDLNCNGDCRQGKWCNQCSTPGINCKCDSYQQVDFEEVASISLLARKNIQRIVTKQDASCPE
jgi:hypothetical protein